MAHFYFLPPKKDNNPWPMAAALLTGFVMLYAVGTLIGIIQP